MSIFGGWGRMFLSSLFFIVLFSTLGWSFLATHNILFCIWSREIESALWICWQDGLKWQVYFNVFLKNPCSDFSWYAFSINFLKFPCVWISEISGHQSKVTFLSIPIPLGSACLPFPSLLCRATVPNTCLPWCSSHKAVIASNPDYRRVHHRLPHWITASLPNSVIRFSVSICTVVSQSVHVDYSVDQVNVQMCHWERYFSKME